MSKIKIFSLIVFVFFCGFRFAFADVVINEIMYDLDGADIDWVEIYNPDSTDVDITSLKLLDSSSTSNHSINNYSGSPILHQGDYGVIVVTSQISSFVSKWGNSGNLFTSSFNLSNTTGKIEINNGDKLSPLSSVSYNSSQGASGDGNSLQLLDGSWKACEPPIPGSATLSSCGQSGGDSDLIDSGNDDETSTSSSYDSEESGVIPVSTFKANILTPSLAFAGQPVEFNLDIKYGNYTFNSGIYYWNFGDGVSKEEKVGFQKFNHTYYYPGEYNISLEYYKSSGSFTPDVVSEKVIKIVPLTISISKVGDYKDFFVELTNSASSRIDISNWVLSANGKSFIFPKNSSISGNKSIIVSGKITGFYVGDEKTLKLIMPTGEIVYDFNTKSAPVKKIIRQTSNFSESENEISNINSEEKAQENSIKNNLAATPVLSETENSKSSYFFIGLIILLGICGGAVYFIRRNRRAITNSVGDDFNIFDE